ncbi:LytR family transcriptional regulator, partial [Mobiluncus curtisii]|nr:LytR family transcriptional regulator [Mobiluncus curtisii]
LDQPVPPEFPYQDMNGNLHQPSEQTATSSPSPDSASSGGSVPAQGSSTGRAGGAPSRGTTATSRANGTNFAHAGQPVGGSASSNSASNVETPARGADTAPNSNSVSTGEVGGNSAHNAPAGEASGDSSMGQESAQ